MDAVQNVLGNAFKSDFSTAVVTGHDPTDTDTSHVGPFWKSTVIAGLLGGEVYVAETVDGEIVGCAVWFGPGHTMYDTEDQQKRSLGPLMASFNEELQHWWHTDFLPRYDSVVASALGGDDVKHNSWHLQTLGVDPAYQRRGAARLLIETVAEKAKITKSFLCLECSTETNVEVYRRLGFEVMPKGDASKAMFTGIKGHSYLMWVMAREPQ
ncbi:N-acetyltransferase domain-containing protein [Mycena sanguinolenta]|uniref:N-acetyltransferase domain-containing protein n=1 Tax=Mycena sanguinolenta TaxID=230812 RepID=A0A8H6ZK33_9AGAR|nr:N-acetyltransferase domain-containing protein [Mycena sanguinolenta]